MSSFFPASCVLIGSLAFAQTGSAPLGQPALDLVLNRMAAARARNSSQLRPYSVTRDYRLFSKVKSATPRAEVVADITFDPPASKHYSIKQSSGMAGLGERIVRQMLDGETGIVRDFGATDITRDNYDVRVLREDDTAGHHCFVLELVPRRKEKTLIRGEAWVDTGTYLLRRFEGQPASKPSWWLQNSRIAFTYGDVGGMWLQISSESTADVRIFGHYVMVSSDREYKLGELAGNAVPAGR